MSKEKRKYYTAVDLPPKVYLDCSDDPSKTRQTEKDAADINVIVKRFYKTGVISVDQRPGLYLDVSEMGDYREAVEQVRQAEGFFMQLPSAVRAKFANDPAGFLDFVSNPENRDEMRKLGLIGGPEATSTASPEASSAS